MTSTRDPVKNSGQISVKGPSSVEIEASWRKGPPDAGSSSLRGPPRGLPPGFQQDIHSRHRVPHALDRPGEIPSTFRGPGDSTSGARAGIDFVFLKRTPPGFSHRIESRISNSFPLDSVVPHEVFPVVLQTAGLDGPSRPELDGHGRPKSGLESGRDPGGPRQGSRPRDQEVFTGPSHDPHGPPADDPDQPEVVSECRLRSRSRPVGPDRCDSRFESR